MITTFIIGGIGNQMFQYAAGRAVSLRLGTPMRLDIAAYLNYGLHQGFELHRIFPRIAKVAPVESHGLGFANLIAIVRKIIKKPFVARLMGGAVLVEPHFSYWDGLEDAKTGSYLSGYWQSEKYFIEAAEQLREDFEFPPPLDDVNAELCNRIRQANAVSLHVRRGDYATDPKNASVYHLCSLEYYANAIDHIAKRVANPEFYVFSDDIDWVKAHLPIAFPHVYVEHNRAAESFNDMLLMSLCKHNIIANSSFSWWGAWLNRNPNRIVVAPARWFANGTDTRDLLPAQWVKL